MKKVIFETKGALDLRAFDTFGINSKPNSTNPFGYFGTGLKYAVAVLLREGCKVTLLTDKKQYRFFAGEMVFRDKKFEQCFYERKEPWGIRYVSRGKIQLPFTLELGKNWKLWQAYRELFSNTLDEGGTAYVSEDSPEPAKDKTYWVVEGDNFAEEHERRFTHTFLPESHSSGQDYGVQILPRESDAIYYRGVRVYQLEEKAKCTYNIFSKLELTEDRTAKDFWQVLTAIKSALLTTDDESILKRALNVEGKEYLENSFDFSNHWLRPSASFTYISGISSNYSARKYSRTFDSDWINAQQGLHYTLRMAHALQEDDFNAFHDLVRDNKEDFINLLLRIKSADWHPDAENITIEKEETNELF
jgi:hypothetical protein